MKASLPWLVNADGDWIVASHQWALDPIGTIIAAPAVLDANFNTVTEATFVLGWHANLRLLDEGLAEIVPAEVQIPAPATPCRVWA